MEGVFERRGEPGQGQLMLPLQLTQPRQGEMGFGKRRGKRDRLLVGVLGDFVGAAPAAGGLRGDQGRKIGRVQVGLPGVVAHDIEDHGEAMMGRREVQHEQAGVSRFADPRRVGRAEAAQDGVGMGPAHGVHCGWRRSH